MVDHADVAARLTENLDLGVPPVAVCFADEAPDGVPEYEGSAPAGCFFWQEAANGAFVTTTSDHELCAIGVHTHSLAAPSSVHASELGKVLGVMAELDYVSDDEVAAIPVVNRPAKHVVYAPLAETPLPPDVVLLFADSRQSLVISEAAQRIQPDVPAAMGRPACAVIPQAMNSGQAVLSLGCCGARAYLDVLSDDVALWAIPVSRLAAFADQVAILSKANHTLASFHAQRRKDVEAGGRPTIEESLARMDSA